MRAFPWTSSQGWKSHTEAEQPQHLNTRFSSKSETRMIFNKRLLIATDCLVIPDANPITKDILRNIQAPYNPTPQSTSSEFKPASSRWEESNRIICLLDTLQSRKGLISIALKNFLVCHRVVHENRRPITIFRKSRFEVGTLKSWICRSCVGNNIVHDIRGYAICVCVTEFCGPRYCYCHPLMIAVVCREAEEVSLWVDPCWSSGYCDWHRLIDEVDDEGWLKKPSKSSACCVRKEVVEVGVHEISTSWCWKIWDCCTLLVRKQYSPQNKLLTYPKNVSKTVNATKLCVCNQLDRQSVSNGLLRGRVTNQRAVWLCLYSVTVW